MALISFRRTTLRVMSWKKKIDRNGSNPLSIIVIFNLFYVRKAGFFQEYGYLVIKMNTTFINR